MKTPPPEAAEKSRTWLKKLGDVLSFMIVGIIFFIVLSFINTLFI